MKTPARHPIATKAGFTVAVMAWATATWLLTGTAFDGLAALRTGTGDLDPAIGGLAAVLGLGLLAWTAVAAVAALLAAALPAGTAAARCACTVSERSTPAAVRRVLAVAVGAALASSAVPAQAAVPSGTRAWAGQGTAAAVVASARLFQPPDLDPAWGRAPAEARDRAAPGPSTAPAPVGADTLPAPVGADTLPVPGPPTGDRPPPVPDPAWGAAGRLRPGLDGTGSEVVVRRGDTLWDLAARHLGPAATDAEIAHAWPRWYRANRAVIGPDPDLLRPGQRLTPPAITPGGAA